MFNPYPVRHEGGTPDKRYEVTREHAGLAKATFVLRFCDEFVAQSVSYSAIVVRAVCHNNVRKGALVFVEQKA